MDRIPLTNTRICETTKSFVVVPRLQPHPRGWNALVQGCRELSLSLSLSVRESELLPVIPPANLRRPIPRWNATFLLHFRFFLSLSLSFKKGGNKIHAKICPFVQSELFGKILYHSSMKDSLEIFGMAIWIRFSFNPCFAPIKERFPS